MFAVSRLRTGSLAFWSAVDVEAARRARSILPRPLPQQPSPPPGAENPVDFRGRSESGRMEDGFSALETSLAAGGAQDRRQLRPPPMRITTLHGKSGGGAAAAATAAEAAASAAADEWVGNVDGGGFWLEAPEAESEMHPP